MKDFRGMKRQRNRNRKPTGQSNNPNRAYESNGPDGTKARGNAQTIYEKYQQLARDANSSGDRVLAENHLQHAEHYFRLIRQTQPQRPIHEYVQRDPFMNGFDLEFEDETDTESQDQSNQDNQEAATQIDDRQYEDQSQRNRDRNRNDRNRPREPRDNADPRDRVDNRERSEPRDKIGFDPEANAQDSSSRRETRRERYERRRQQRLVDQEDTMTIGRFDPPAGTIVPQAFIASTEPLGAYTGRTNQDQGADQEAKARISDDASQLPAFLHAPVPITAPIPTNAEESVADSNTEFDLGLATPVKKPRARRAKAVEADI